MSDGHKPAIVVTGVSGDLGRRLLPLLDDFNVTGVDIVPPRTNHPLRYEKIDLSREAACRQLVQVLKQSEARVVVHLASIVDSRKSGVLDVDQMWQVNVAGTARVMEAITETNRQGGVVDTFVFPGSTFVYGPDTPGPVKENHPLAAESLPYALHAQQADEAVRVRCDTLGKCSTYVVRMPTFAGASVNNYLIGGYRGTPAGKAKRAERMRQRNKRLSLFTPGKIYRQNLWQFIHVDDAARLIAYVLRRPPTYKNELTLLNASGRGEPISFEQAAALANARVRQVPGKWIMREVLRLLWDFDISGVPPEAAPYLYGSCLADTTRLKQFLGSDYDTVIRYSVATALQDSFKAESDTQFTTA
ncbi:MAG: NAD-dependent epimerase/dehydratase family protein [Terriglobales bacterium]